MDPNRTSDSKESLSVYRDSLLSSSTYLCQAEETMASHSRQIAGSSSSNNRNIKSNNKRVRRRSDSGSSEEVEHVSRRKQWRTSSRKRIRKIFQAFHGRGASPDHETSVNDEDNNPSNKRRKCSPSSKKTVRLPPSQFVDTSTNRNQEDDSISIQYHFSAPSSESWSCGATTSSMSPFETREPEVPNFNYDSPASAKPYIYNRNVGDCFNNNDDYNMNNSDFLTMRDQLVSENSRRSSDDLADTSDQEPTRSRSYVSLRSLKGRVRDFFSSNRSPRSPRWNGFS